MLGQPGPRVIDARIQFRLDLLAALVLGDQLQHPQQAFETLVGCGGAAVVLLGELILDGQIGRHAMLSSFALAALRLEDDAFEVTDAFQVDSGSILIQQPVGVGDGFVEPAGLEV